jgi:hypothetical protein
MTAFIVASVILSMQTLLKYVSYGYQQFYSKLFSHMNTLQDMPKTHSNTVNETYTWQYSYNTSSTYLDPSELVKGLENIFIKFHSGL